MFTSDNKHRVFATQDIDAHTKFGPYTHSQTNEKDNMHIWRVDFYLFCLGFHSISKKTFKKEKKLLAFDFTKI